MLLLLTGGLGLVLRHSQLGSDAHQQILEIAAEHCSPSLEAKIEHVLLQFEQQSATNGPIGFLATLAAALGVFYQFERAFDKIWQIPAAPGSSLWRTLSRMVRDRLAAFLLLAGVGAGIFCVLLINLAFAVITRWLGNTALSGALLLLPLHWILTIGLNALAFGALFRWLPKRSVQWQHAFRGGLLTAVVWELGRQLLESYMIGMRYTTAYGAIGSFIGLLLWFYWGVSLLLFGAEYVQVLSRNSLKQINLLDSQAVRQFSERRERNLRQRTLLARFSRG
jgi:membrane protein